MSAQILLIDDEPHLLLALSAYLRRAGYQVVSVPGGKEALVAMRDWLPDLIICDIMMPGMDGLDVRRELEKDDRYRDIPFIFLTAKGQLDDRLEGLHSGADDYIVKPFEPSELEARIEALLRRVTRDQALAEREIESLKNNILANITHELRTPMSIVRSTLELVLEGAFGSNAEQEREFLSRALQSTHDLQFLIDDLLLITALESGELQLLLAPFSVDGFLRHIGDKTWRVEPAGLLQIQRSDISDLTICADRRYLEIVLGHLVDNAFKFSPEGSPVEIRARVQGDGLAILVTDRGPGIAAEHLPHIFDRFYQIDMSSTRSYDGLGCGLYLAQSLARAHNGCIKVESELGKGSCFTIWLPQGLPEGLHRPLDLTG